METERLISWRLFTNTAVASMDVVFSPQVDVTRLIRVESLMLLMTSTGDAHDLQVEFAAAAEPGSQDETNYTLLSASTAGEFGNANTVALSFPPTLGGAISFRLTGVGANPADTLVTAVLIGREG